MIVTFVGVGSAFSKINSKSNVLVQSGDTQLLIDCGNTALTSLQSCGVKADGITHIFVTHLHNDHIGGLEEVALNARLIFDHSPVLISTESLLHRLWHHSLKGGLEFLELEPGDETPQTLEDYFSPLAVPVGEWAPVSPGAPLEIYLHSTRHVAGLESYALWVRDTTTKKQFMFSGDTRLDLPLLESSMECCDYLFHDCQLFETGPDNEAGVHVSYQQLEKLSKEIRSKMWLYHYGDTERPDAKAAGFLGFVQHHQTFEM